MIVAVTHIILEALQTSEEVKYRSVLQKKLPNMNKRTLAGCVDYLVTKNVLSAVDSDFVAMQARRHRKAYQNLLETDTEVIAEMKSTFESINPQNNKQ